MGDILKPGNCKFVIPVLFVFSQSLSAATYNSSGIYITTGKSNVTANEIVYGSSRKISHLTWKTQNAPVTTLGIREKITDSVILNIEGKSLNKNSKSVMDDYDWLYTSTSDWSDWSHHEDTLLTQSDSFNASLAFTLFGGDSAYFSLIGGYREETIQWKSYGGSYVYSSSSFRDSTGNFATGSPAIDYKQEYTTPYYGLKAGALFGHWLYTLQAITSNSSSLTATDLHHARNLIFKDTFNSVRMNSYKLGIGYLIGDKFSFNFTYDLRSYKEAVGSTVQTSSVTGNITGSCSNCAGADNTSATSSVGLAIYF